MKHKDTFDQLKPFFPELKQEDLPDGEAWAVEQIELNTHNGTHLDAPYHFHSTMISFIRVVELERQGLFGF